MGPPARLCVLYPHKENSSERWFFGPGVLMSCSLRALPLSLTDPSSPPQAEMISICQLHRGQEALDVSQMQVTPLTLSV